VANPQNNLVDSLFEKLKREKISVPKFAAQTGIPKDRVYKWKQEGTSPKAEDERKIKAWMSGEKMEIFPREIGSEVIVSLSESYKTLAEATKIQAKANENQSQANKSMAETQHVLAKNNEELVDIVKEKSHHLVPKAMIVDPSRIMDLVEVLVELAMAAKVYEDEKEARRIIGIRLRLHEGDKENSVGTRAGVSKRNTVG
jgi:hypothetical protein